MCYCAVNIITFQTQSATHYIFIGLGYVTACYLMSPIVASVKKKKMQQNKNKKNFFIANIFIQICSLKQAYKGTHIKLCFTKI